MDLTHPDAAAMENSCRRMVKNRMDPGDNTGDHGLARRRVRLITWRVSKRRDDQVTLDTEALGRRRRLPVPVPKRNSATVQVVATGQEVSTQLLSLGRVQEAEALSHPAKTAVGLVCPPIAVEALLTVSGDAQPQEPRRANPSQRAKARLILPQPRLQPQ